ncbi:hypothetical protein [Streptomyces sporangiiformans]|uniref:Tat pathway signal sequence domain protein n=1 Tax=Streptomyces sporangiiformans TaxID=2315329 RepID=A0A505D3K1_9ACTN|nr:hypothetical protein [Streptomyces sporangiiformans]TPQ18274.1 hypothetical protein FGD71_032080 [Streptomyces sporangiiformans]
MQEISRRTVLVGAATAAVTLTVPAPTAHAMPTENTRNEESAPGSCETMGSTEACVEVRQIQDVCGIQYTIKNHGDAPRTYSVSCLDVDGGPNPGTVTVSVEAGESVSDYFYGDLLHCFTLQVCPVSAGKEMTGPRTSGKEADVTCMTLGPVCAESSSDW